MGGITIFRPDAGIDAGPIYSKHEIEIGPDDTAGSFYYARVFEPGVAAMVLYHCPTTSPTDEDTEFIAINTYTGTFFESE